MDKGSDEVYYLAIFTVNRQFWCPHSVKNRSAGARARGEQAPGSAVGLALARARLAGPRARRAAIAFSMAWTFLPDLAAAGPWLAGWLND